MNFFQRAIKNVSRSLTKTVLLIITFFVIGNFVIVGLGIANASENAKTLTRQKMRAVVTYQIDYDEISKYLNSLDDEDAINDFYENYPRIRLEDVKEILKDERVEVANSLYTTMYYSEMLKFVPLHNQYEESINQGGNCYYDEERGETFCYNDPNFFVKGNFFPGMIEFVDGDYELVEGRLFNEEELNEAKYVAVISDELAKENGLRLGDYLELACEDPANINRWYEGMDIKKEDLIARYEVIGIYHTDKVITPDNSNFEYCVPYENPLNTIFVPGTSSYRHYCQFEAAVFDGNAKLNPDDEYYQDSANRPDYHDLDDLYMNDVTILLNDPLNVDAFVADYQEKLPQFMMLNANNEEFRRLAKPLDTLSLYSSFVVWLVVINSIIIITLVVALTLKTREYEIGVLLSIGASKLKVIAQFFIELAIVAILGFSLSVVSGSLIANKIGTAVLEYQIQADEVVDENYYYEDDYFNVWDSDYSTDIELEDLVSEYRVSVSPMIILEIYVLGLGIVLVSIIIPSLMIMRFNPKKILMNQN